MSMYILDKFTIIYEKFTIIDNRIKPTIVNQKTSVSCQKLNIRFNNHYGYLC